MLKTPRYTWINVPTVQAGFSRVPHVVKHATTAQPDTVGKPYGGLWSSSVFENSVLFHPDDIYIEKPLHQRQPIVEPAEEAQQRQLQTATTKRRAAFSLFAAAPLVTGAGLVWNWYQAKRAPWDKDFELATRMMDSADMVVSVAVIFSAILVLIGAVFYFPSRKVIRRSRDD